MELTLAQNIRSYRKQKKMTQEQLSEVLGVTVGAVHKWESGLSVPELPLIVEMADFFDVSVDVLLGHRMKDNSVRSICERLNEYCRTLDPVALPEAEKALGKYPHSFQIVLGCATVYLVFGTGSHDRKQLERALELLKQSRVLLPQNNDPRIGDVTICGAMATVLFLLGKTDECLDLLKKNNAGGLFNDHIGMTLAAFGKRSEEASGYLADALTDGVSTLLTSIIGYVFVFRSREDWKSALDILDWGMRILEGLMTDRKAGALIKTHAQMFALLSYVQEKAGKAEESEYSLREVFRLAMDFDSTPDYSLSEMRFADNAESMMVFDIFGASATGSIDRIVGLLGDEGFAGRWKEMTENGR